MSRHIKTAVCLAMVLLLLLTAGCGSARELNELVIVMGMGLDVNENDPQSIKLIAQIVKSERISTSSSGGSSSGSDEPYYNLVNNAPNTFEGIRDYTHMVSGRLYSAHTQLIVIGREFAQRGIAPNMDFFVRSKETRPTTKIIVSDTTASEVLDLSPHSNMLPTINMDKLVEEQRDNSQSEGANLLDYIKAMQSRTTAFIAPIVRISECEGEKVLEVRGMAVFRQDTMVGELGEYEMRGVLWAKGKIESTVINVNIADGIAALEVMKPKSTMKTVISNGKIRMEIHISANASLAEQTCTENLETSENVKRLEQMGSETIIKEIQSAFDKAVALKADFFGFGEKVKQTGIAGWEEMENNWDQVFSTIEIGLSVDLRIVTMGSIQQPVEAQG